MAKLSNRGEINDLVYKALQGWNNAFEDVSGDDDVKAVIKALSDATRARLYAKRSGNDYEQYFRDLSNACVGHNRECPQDATEANRQLESYRPMCFTRKKSEDREQHSLDGASDKKFNYFRCGRSRPV